MHEKLESTEDKIRILAEWIKESNYIVFFGGAGTSTESGLKSFRGSDKMSYTKKGTNKHISTLICKLVRIF